MHTHGDSKFAAKEKYICSKGLPTESKFPEHLIMPLLLGISVSQCIALISCSSCLLHALFHLWCWGQTCKKPYQVQDQQLCISSQTLNSECLLVCAEEDSGR